MDDSAECGLSSFMVEMRDIAYLLQNVTDSSLVIMDELGRGMVEAPILLYSGNLIHCEQLRPHVRLSPLQLLYVKN